MKLLNISHKVINAIGSLMMMAIFAMGTAKAQEPPADSTQAIDPRLQSVYTSNAIWNGVATSGERVFVCFPHNDGSPGTRIGEVTKDGKVVPYPNEAWNNWTVGADAKQKFVRTNSLRFGPDGNLWIVDTGTPKTDGEVVPNGPKLIAIDIKTNRVVRSIPLDALAKKKSFIDDLRFNGSNIYVTDAGAPGLIVLDAATGKGRRVLDDDISTTALRPLYGEGKLLLKPTGAKMELHADQMEVSPDGKYFYFQTASGPMYRVETRFLDDPAISSAKLAHQVQFWYDTPTTGGTTIDAEGNLYINDANEKRLLKLTPDGKASTILSDSRLVWGDAMWIDNDGFVWIPAPQMNRTPEFNQGKSVVKLPVHLYKLKLDVQPLRN